MIDTDTSSVDELTTFPTLPLPPGNLRHAACRFVNEKYALDNSPESVLKSLFRWYTYGKLPPHEYCRNVLPFFDFEETDDDEPLGPITLVPTEIVIGASDDWNYRDLLAKDEDAPKQAVHDIFELSSRYANGENVHNVAEYFYIKPLGFVIAHEGKNRVDLFRNSGITHIPARLGSYGYPAPDRIKIYTENTLTVAVLDGTYACLISYPHLVVPLLTAYGIANEQRWDTCLAPFDDVRQKLLIPNTSQRCPNYLDQYIDLRKIAYGSKTNGEFVPAALTEIIDVRPRWQLIGQLSAFLLGIFIVCALLPTEWIWPSVFVGATCGALVMLVGAFTLPLIELPRRVLSRPLPQRQETPQSSKGRRKHEI